MVTTWIAIYNDLLDFIEMFRQHLPVYVLDVGSIICTSRTM